MFSLQDYWAVLITGNHNHMTFLGSCLGEQIICHLILSVVGVTGPAHVTEVKIMLFTIIWQLSVQISQVQVLI